MGKKIEGLEFNLVPLLKKGSAAGGLPLWKAGFVAGMAGFEPTNAGVWSSGVVLPHLSHSYAVRDLTP